uniref:glycosyltransferase n=1 Tax=Brachyspira sp. TaxID=1977261 RepID=UPI002613E662
MNIKIAYDAEVFLSVKRNNNNRGGIYFVAYNIAKLFLHNKNIDLYFYIYEVKEVCELNNYLNEIFPNYDIKIIHNSSKEWIDIDIFYSSYRRPENFITNNKNITKYIFIHDITPVIDNYLDWGNGIFKHIDNKYIYFCNSQYTKDELIKYSNGILEDNKVHVTLLSYDQDRFEKKELNDYIRNKYNIPKNKKYVFTLCGLYPRKNLIRNIITFHQFIDKHNIKDMVFIMGGYHLESFLETFNKEIKEYKDRILRLGYVDDEDVAYLYSGAEWFIYTSQLEGFGIPPLEAMACGCPVITSN